MSLTCIKPVLTWIMQDVNRDLSRPRFSKVFFEGIQRHLRSWPLSLGWITHASGRGYSGSWRLLQTELRKKLKERHFMCIVTGNAMHLHKVLSSFLFNFFGHWFFFHYILGLEFVICFVWLAICYMWWWEIELTLDWCLNLTKLNWIKTIIARG